MKFTVMTLFPEMVEQTLSHSIMKRARDNDVISLRTVNIRDFADNKHNRVDDYPYGGGAGMVMEAMPVYKAFKSFDSQLPSGTPVVFLSPQGRRLDQNLVEELSKFPQLVLLCGHYEGVDQRVLDEIVTMEVSIGDYVLTGGELGAVVLIDAVSRLVPQVLGKEESFLDESFSENLLEYPQYTRPQFFLEREVPPVLLSGNHAKIKDWRRQMSLKNTFIKRPDLLDKADLDAHDLKFLAKLKDDL